MSNTARKRHQKDDTLPIVQYDPEYDPEYQEQSPTQSKW